MEQKNIRNDGMIEEEEDRAIENSTRIDMLHGPLIMKLFLFAIPVAASSILQQLFHSADVAVVGRFAGSKAMAAVGGNSSVSSLIINLFVGLSMGTNVVIANYIGQKATKKVQDTIHTVMVLAILSGIFLLFLGQFIAEPILRLMNTPDDVIDLAALYLRIYFLGMPFLMVYNFGAAILRSVGDTKRPLFILFVSGIINVCLNLLLVLVFHLGVSGVAIATVIADGASAGLVLYFLIKEKGIIHLDLKKLSMKKEQVIRVTKIGAPSGIQGMVFSLSNVCIQTAINSFGSDAIAGSSAAVNFEFFTYFVTSAFSQAAVTFISQNFGAGQQERCKKIFRYSLILGLIFTNLMSISFVIFRGFFIRFYTIDPPVIEYALIRMIHVELFACIPVLYESGAAGLRGMGYSLLPTILTLIGSCALRFVWVYTVFRRYRSFGMLMNVYPVTWFVTGTMMLLAYVIVRNKVFSKENGVL